MDLADELKKGLSLSRSSVMDKSELLDDDTISLTSSDPAASALLSPSQEEQEMLDEDEEIESSKSSCPAYMELLVVMERATVRHDLLWKRARKVTPRGRLDEHYLSDNNPPAQLSLPFLHDLHVEIEKTWKNLFSSHIHRFQRTIYANIEGVHESRYEKMPTMF